MRQVASALAAVDTCGSAKAIAVMLSREGCTGARGSAGGCPVARHLRDVLTDPPYWMEVYPSKVRACAKGQTIVEVKTPRHVAAFVRAFDAGKYPELRQP